MSHKSLIHVNFSDISDIFLTHFVRKIMDVSLCVVSCFWLFGNFSDVMTPVQLLYPKSLIKEKNML